MVEFKPGEKIARIVKTKGFDTSSQGYDTSLPFYGGTVKTIKEDGREKIIYDMSPTINLRGIINEFDRLGDRRVRSTDEHIADSHARLKSLLRKTSLKARRTAEMVGVKNKSEEQQTREDAWIQSRKQWDAKETAQKVAPRSLLKTFSEGFIKGYSLRHRHIGTPQQIADNIHRLGLDEYYAAHAKGIEFKKPEIYTEGISLYDLVIADKEGKVPLQGIDRNQALSETAKYVREVHDNHGGIGELLIHDIQFQKRDGDKVSEPVLGLPDIVWNEKTTLSETAKKATDMLDFLMNVSFWERKVGISAEEIKHDLDTIIKSYGDVKVMQAVRAFANPDRKGKRLTLPGEGGNGGVFRMPSESHNVARLGAEKQWSSEVRQSVFNAAQEYIDESKGRTPRRIDSKLDTKYNAGMTEAPRTSPEAARKKLGDRVIHDTVKQSRLRTYENVKGETVDGQTGVYGGVLRRDNQDHLVFDMRGLRNPVGKIDQIGDGRFRRADDATPKDLGKIAKRGVREVFRAVTTRDENGWSPDYNRAGTAIKNANKFLSPGLIEPNPKRYRGTAEEMAANAKRLGLSEYYGIHEWGVEIKKPEVFSKGISLHDIFRADQIDSPEINKIDRFEALNQATTYLRDTHLAYGHIGEALLADFIFQEVDKDKGTVSNPVLNITDIVPNPRITESETGRRATDVLDFMICAATQEYRRSHNWNSVQHALSIIAEGYGDPRVLSAARSFMKRGRVVMEGDGVKSNMLKEPAGRLHNNIRLGVSVIPEEERGKLREMVTQELTPSYVERRKQLLEAKYLLTT